MDINTQNSSGMMNGMPPVSPAEKKVGPIVGVMIIVLILIIAGLYFFGQKLNDAKPIGLPPEQQASVNTVRPVDSSVAVADTAQADDITSLQSDLSVQMQDVDYSF